MPSGWATSRLSRSAATLSGGEGQRIRLATQIGSKLRGVLYVLDEPSIGLHHRDNDRLLQALESLRDLGNTVLVVEHDEDTIRRADYVIDLGPGAGRHGGEVVASGTPDQIQAAPHSLTGQYISGQKQITDRHVRRQPNGKAITILGARENNLKNLDVSFPLGVMTVVTGVSGSGKSTLVNDILYRALANSLYRSREEAGEYKSITGTEFIDKVIRIDQSPIGRTPRSNPATYTGVFTQMRDLYAMLPESRERGYKAGRFSFNVAGGRCEACQGEGQRRIEMNFLPDVYVLCEVCGGKRYNHETLAVKYKGYSIADLLETPVADALPVLENIPQIKQKLQTLVDVGLGYIHLGQSAVTLSGGEAQRIKLARELSKRQTGKTLYLLDEPTTGLHFDDVSKLLEVLHRLTDLGNSIIIIEHNLDVIRNADWIIDLGPEGGEDGGRVVAQGTPEQVARVKKSYTGQILAKVLPQASNMKANGEAAVSPSAAPRVSEFRTNIFMSLPPRIITQPRSRARPRLRPFMTDSLRRCIACRIRSRCAGRQRPGCPAVSRVEDLGCSGDRRLQYCRSSLFSRSLRCSWPGVSAVRNASFSDLATDARVVIGAQAAAYPIILLFIFLLVRSRSNETFRQAIRWNWPGATAPAFIASGIVLALVVDSLARFLPIPKSLPMDSYFHDATSAYIMTAFGVTLAPLLEEMFFRGLLLSDPGQDISAWWQECC